MFGNLSKLILVLTIICLLLDETQCEGKKYKILGLFSHPGKSHFAMFKPILEELAIRGHDLTVVSYFPRGNKSSLLPNYKDIDLKRKTQIYVNVIDLNSIKHDWLTAIREFFWIYGWAVEHCQEALEIPDVKKLINSNDAFDLVITEAFNSDCFLPFAHKFNAPVVGLSSHVLMPWINSYMSNGFNPSYVPILFAGYAPNMNFFERFTNTFLDEIFSFGYNIIYNRPMQKIVDDAFGRNLPPLINMAQNITAILVNTHYSLHGNKPHLPNVVEVGGIHLAHQKKQELPGDIRKFLDDGIDGVLYFSFGSMIKVSSMSPEKLDIILKVLGSIPRRVIWKWEEENLPGKPKNMMIKKWLPQAEILAHPNVKCYLAHGGLLGLSEGIRSGIPAVIFPMYGDQPNNAAAAKSRGIAEVLEWTDLNAESFRDALDKVFNDSTYQKNARALQKAWNDRPESPLETAIWWVEYVARGNGNHFLKTAASDLAWYQLHLLDVFALFILIILIITTVWYKVLCLVIKKFNSPCNEKLDRNGIKKNN